jgi:hypothetical protein
MSYFPLKLVIWPLTFIHQSHHHPLNPLIFITPFQIASIAAAILFGLIIISYLRDLSFDS